ncbi:ATP-binding protein [Geitlerinema sp. CS-897]|nr:ATP-binding protein [Geitlerinema sp. CS-897]
MATVSDRSNSPPRKSKRSLARQLLGGLGISLIAIGATTLGVNYKLLETDLEHKIEQQATSLARSIEFVSEGLIELQYVSILQRVVQNYATLPNVVEIAIVDPDGILLAYSATSPRQRPFAELRPELADLLDRASVAHSHFSEKTTLDGRAVLVNVQPFSSVLFGTSGRRGLSIAILDLHTLHEDARSTFLQSSATLMGGIFAILGLMSLLLQKTVLVPLQQLDAAVTRSQSTGQFHCPKPLPHNEIGVLATVLEGAFQALQQEILRRTQTETALRDSESREKTRSRELQQTLENLKKTQAQLIHTEKMSSLGQMVAGVAHEINNPIGFVYGNLAHLEEYTRDLIETIHLYQRHCPDPPPEIRHHLHEIDFVYLEQDLPQAIASMQAGAQRIRDIVLSLRNFSRLDESEMKEADFNQGIDSTLLTVSCRLKPQERRPEIQVVREYDDLPPVECYPGQLNQVVLNLLNNAVDALDTRSDNPTIWIRTTLVSVPDNTRYVRLSVRDNGSGITEEVRSKLFDPFFTTKPVGRGTGLGLSISYQIIVERHRGTLSCQSVPGGGTEFVATIPVAQTVEHTTPQNLPRHSAVSREIFPQASRNSDG